MDLRGHGDSDAAFSTYDDLAAGSESAVIWANDLTADYVHENSAYSS